MPLFGHILSLFLGRFLEVELLSCTVSLGLTFYEKDTGGISRAQDFQGIESVIWCSYGRYMPLHLPKPIKRKTPRMNPKANYGLCSLVIMACRRIVINCNKGTSLVGDLIMGEAVDVGGESVYGKSQYLPLSLAVNQTLLMRAKPIKNKYAYYVLNPELEGARWVRVYNSWIHPKATGRIKLHILISGDNLNSVCYIIWFFTYLVTHSDEKCYILGLFRYLNV